MKYSTKNKFSNLWNATDWRSDISKLKSFEEITLCNIDLSSKKCEAPLQGFQSTYHYYSLAIRKLSEPWWHWNTETLSRPVINTSLETSLAILET